MGRRETDYINDSQKVRNDEEGGWDGGEVLGWQGQWPQCIESLLSTPRVVVGGIE